MFQTVNCCLLHVNYTITRVIEQPIAYKPLNIGTYPYLPGKKRGYSKTPHELRRVLNLKIRFDPQFSTNNRHFLPNSS